jgi:ParB family chromosome partitioning protein
VPKHKGLPELTKMRHDFHFVDELSAKVSTTFGRMLPVSKIEPNPHQPRTSPGNLTELKASIKQKGILEPLLVRVVKGKYQIISGERRFTAAKELGLAEVPCIILQASDEESLEISLIENLQREDLSPFEEAEGLYSLAKHFGYTHEEIAVKIGKSRATVTETISLVNIPSDLRDLCNEYGINSKSMLLQIARQSNIDEMSTLINSIAKRGLKREDVRAILSLNKTKDKHKNYVFKFRPKDRSFSFQIRFNKPQISRQEIIEYISTVIDFIKSQDTL